MNIRNEILEPDCFYHIYNRGISSVKIFNEDKNYSFFVGKFLEYSRELLDVYAYCLMPTHFHFIVKIKSEPLIQNFIAKQIHGNCKAGLHNDEMIVSKQIAKFISSYTQAFNKSYNRHGPLLESPFKRKKIIDEEYLKNAIIYIHLTPQDIVENFERYRYSSYNSILSDNITNIKRTEVLEQFGGNENFIYTHQFPPKFAFKF